MNSMEECDSLRSVHDVHDVYLWCLVYCVHLFVATLHLLISYLVHTMKHFDACIPFCVNAIN